MKKTVSIQRQEVLEIIASYPEESNLDPVIIARKACKRHDGESLTDWSKSNDMEMLTIICKNIVRASAVDVTLGATPDQMTIPGMGIHKRYLCQVDGRSIAVHYKLMTDEQWDEKLDELRAFKAGVQEHIDSIIKYRKEAHVDA